MAFFNKVNENFSKNKDKDIYLSGLDKSRRSFGDRIRALSNSYRGIDEELLEEAVAFQNVGKQANRIKCATIGWKGFEELLNESEKTHE